MGCTSSSPAVDGTLTVKADLGDVATTGSSKAKTPSPKAKTPSPKAKTPSPKAAASTEEVEISVTVDGDEPTEKVERPKSKRSSKKKSKKIGKIDAKLDLSKGVTTAAGAEYKCSFQANKWTIDNATAEQGTIEITVEKPMHTVYIYNAKGATIIVNGKCNSIAVDKSEKSKVLCDTLVATLEVTNSKRMQVQVREFSPSIAIDSTDGCLCYLSQACIENPDFNITASKSSEMNISFPWGPDGDYIERPLCEQFKYNIDKDSGKIETEESDLYTS